MHDQPQQGRPRRDAELFEALFEQALDAVLIADDDRRYVDANPGACELIGLPREFIIGRRVEEFFEVVERPAVSDAWSAFQREGTQTGVCRVPRPDGSIRYASFQAKANFWKGLHLSILRDITEQWVAEEALTETNKRLQEANKELERSNAELSHFAHAVGHDLGAPLRTIGLFSELMRRKAGPDDEVHEYASEIKSAIHGINTFLEDLLAFAQVGRGGRPLRRVNSEAVLQFSLANLRAAIDESGAVIRHDPLPEVHADERQLTQLFQNLVSNSLKYRGESPPRIHIKADASGDEWLFSISDNGVGIPPDRQTMIFEMFKRLHGREIPGTGLGLALCKRIVENYGGRIWVESEPGRGSIFWFTVPADMRFPQRTDNEPD